MNPPTTEQIRLIRYDLDVEGIHEPGIQDINRETCPMTRSDLLTTFDLPNDAIVKLSFEGKLFPWSLFAYFASFGSVDIQIFRPHQNIKPRHQEDLKSSDLIVREKVCRLENRITSLENEMDETTLQKKTERDLQLLTKQISFLGKRLDEADQAEWIKKS